MTYFKPVLLTGALVLAVTTSPALAQDAMDQTDMRMETQQMKSDAMKHDKKMHKKMATDQMKMYDAEMMPGKMKSGQPMQMRSMTAAERMDAERRILAKMSNDEKRAYANMDSSARQAMMNKKLMGDYQPGHAMPHSTGTMMPNGQTTGQVLQRNEPANPTRGDDDILMSRGQTPDVNRVRSMESDGMISNNAIVVPTVNNQAITTVSCPVGTTAQTNGTCMITGNYNYGN